MALIEPIVFLVDVDNTLLDNDRIQDDLKRHLEREFGADCRDRYWAILEQLFTDLGYRDYLGALQRFRVEHPREPHLLSMSSFLVDYPFANRLYPGSLDVLERFRSWGRTVILSDGDVVFQPRKVERSGIFEAVEGHVLIYIHKEEALDDVERRYPAEHYVLVDDKVRILDAVKKIWGDRVTTIFPRQGQYAHDAKSIAGYRPADLTVERIGELLDYDLAALLAANNQFKISLEVKVMKATQLLHNLGQSLWLDNITRDLLNTGTLKRYIDEFSVTGLTSNPTIFDHAIKNSTAYDAAIRKKLDEGKSGEELFFELALEDLTRAADLFRPIYDRTNGVDGWVSLEVSPLLAHDTTSTVAAAKSLHARAGRPNLFIKIPGTKEGRPASEEARFAGAPAPAPDAPPESLRARAGRPNLFIKIPGTKEGLPAIEEAIFAGVPINVTLLFSREHYVAAAEAFLRGIERCIDAGLNPNVGSVASVFISRWDAAVMGKVPDALRD